MELIPIKTEQEIALIRESSLIVSKALAEVARHIRPGVTTLELDTVAEQFIRSEGGEPAFKNYEGAGPYPYPYTLCISVNDEVVHGMPGTGKVLSEGDIVSVDCGVRKNGYYGDSAYTFAVGEVSPKKLRLMSVTRQCLFLAIQQSMAGKRIGDIGFAVQHHAEFNGFSVVKEMVGHGVGAKLHEAPEVPNYGRKGTGHLLKPNMVIAIEPMINMGKARIVTDRDGWTIRAADRLPSAHFEHTVWVKEGEAEALTTFEFIEEVLK